MFEKLRELLKKKGKSEGQGEPLPESKAPSSAQTGPKDFPKEPKKEVKPEPVKASKSSSQQTKPVKVTKAPKKGKHGLNVIDKAMDLEALFESEGEHTPPPPPKPKKPVRVAPAQKHAKKKAKKRSKNGILILDGEGDILSQMAQEAEREGDRVVGQAPKREIEPAPALKKVQKDKNGLPILGEEQMPSGNESEDFAALLASSLSEKSEAVLLHEKRDRVEPVRQISVAERLKYYPPVQAELDLHGYTAAKADQTAELYIRRAYSVGTYTLRIIVGKGLHSEHGAVLPDVISDRLTALKQDGIVLEWKWEKGKKSKSGAMVVYLNNYDSSKFTRSF